MREYSCCFLKLVDHGRDLQPDPDVIQQSGFNCICIHRYLWNGKKRKARIYVSYNYVRTTATTTTTMILYFTKGTELKQKENSTGC